VDLSRIDCCCCRRRWGWCRRGGYKLFGGVTGSFRRRKAYPQRRLHRSTKLPHRRKQNKDFPAPTPTTISECSTDCAVIDAVENKAPGIVCEPDNELSLLVFSDPDFFFCDGLNLQLLFSCQVFSFEEPRLIIVRGK